MEFRDSSGTLSKKVEFDYDVFDRRIGKRVDDDGDGTFDRGLRYVYDDGAKRDPATGTPLDDIVLVFEDESLGDGSLTNRYLHGPAVDQVLADDQFVAGLLADTYWALGDNQNTVRDVANYNAVLDETTIAKHRAFASFGEITSDTAPSLPFLYAYTGREWDPDAELYHYRARWYDANVGKFVSEDPIGFAAGDTNLGRYVGNSSTNATDPPGLQQKDDIQREKDKLKELDKELLKQLGGDESKPEKPTVAQTCPIPWKLANGVMHDGKIVAVKDGKVTLRVVKDGKESTIEIPLDKFNKDDQNLIEQLQIVPANVIINPNGKGAEAKEFLKNVVEAVAILNKLPTGKQIIQGISRIFDPPPAKFFIKGKWQLVEQKGKDTPIFIFPTTRTKDGLPDSSVKELYMDPKGKLSTRSDRPPMIYFNPASEFKGLGKELWHTWQALGGATVPNPMKLPKFLLWNQWDVKDGGKIKRALEKEHKAMDKCQ